MAREQIKGVDVTGLISLADIKAALERATNEAPTRQLPAAKTQRVPIVIAESGAVDSQEQSDKMSKIFIATGVLAAGISLATAWLGIGFVNKIMQQDQLPESNFIPTVPSNSYPSNYQFTK